MRGTCGVLKRVFGYARSDKREFKESFSNMSVPMFSRENARCAILPILSLLATLDMIPVLKTPFNLSMPAKTHIFFSTQITII